MALQISRSASLEDARKAVMQADSGVSNALKRVNEFMESEGEIDPKIHKVRDDLERVHRTMMRATKTLTMKRLGGR